MGSNRFQSSESNPPKELAVRFWSLVLLAKLAVLVIGAGVILLGFTAYRTIGAGMLLVGIVIAVRWAHLFRRARREFAGA